MSLCPAFRNRLRSLWHQFFGTIALIEFVLKNLCQQPCSFSLTPCQRTYACPMSRVWKLWQVLGAQFFRNNRILMKFGVVAPSQWSSPKLFPAVSCPSTTSPLPSRSLPTKLSPSYFPQFPVRPCASSLGALPKLFPTVSIPFMMSPLRLVSPNRALPKLFPTVSFPFMMSSLQSRSLPTERSPQAISHCFPDRSWCRRFCLAPSQRSSPQAISDGFLSRLWCRRFRLASSNGALPELFPTVSFPFMISLLPSRSLPTELSPSYFPRFPFRSWYRRFRLAPPAAK